MKFTKSGYDRWNSGPYVVAKYDDGFYAYHYSRYELGGRDAKRLHPEDRPLPSFNAAMALCATVAKQTVPDGIVLIDAPVQAV